MGQAGQTSAMELKQEPDGRWRLSFRPAEVTYSAYSTEKLIYKHRKSRQAQDWLRMPVGNLIRDEAEAYLKWLNETGRFPGARLCTEHEWERAAPGSDRRAY